jgi:hypothetical protein
MYLEMMWLQLGRILTDVFMLSELARFGILVPPPTNRPLTNAHDPGKLRVFQLRKLEQPPQDGPLKLVQLLPRHGW